MKRTSLAVAVLASALGWFLPPAAGDEQPAARDASPEATKAPGSEPKKPAAPTEFAFVLSNGYGEGDRFSNDPKVFENLLVNMKKSGFNAIHCVYRDWRGDLCRKHGVRMMIDVLAWKEGGLTDIRRPEQREAVRKICEKVRGDDGVWGYNLWNEALR